jgi:hypothetical protein
VQPAASPAILELLPAGKQLFIVNRSTCAYTFMPAHSMRGALLAANPGFRVRHTFPWLLSLSDRSFCGYSRVPDRIGSADDPV